MSVPRTIPPAALIQLLVVVVIFGAAFVVIRIGLDEASPAWLAFWRAALSAGATAVLVAARGRLTVPARGDWPVVAAVGAGQLAAFFALLHLAMTVLPPGRSALLSYTTALWLVPISVLALGEAMDMRRGLAVLLGVSGVIVLANPWSVDWADPRQLPAHGLLLLASLCWAIAITVLRRSGRGSGSGRGASLLDLLPWQFGLAALLLLPVAMLLEPDGGITLGWSSGFALLYLGVFGGPLATWAANSVSRALPVVVTSIGFLGVPVVGLALSVIALGERLTPSLLLGGALILAGLATLALRR